MYTYSHTIQNISEPVMQLENVHADESSTMYVNTAAVISDLPNSKPLPLTDLADIIASKEADKYKSFQDEFKVQ